MASPPPPRHFDLHRFQLDNGLRVVLEQDPSAPLVAVNLWYHVGSKNERPGRTGFAHLFEHMLFQGSEHAGNRHFALIQERGGTANGSTSFDRTNYYETLPSSELELALWLEADRMGFLLGGLTQEKFDNQREVVKNERRFRVDNQPYGTWMEKGFELLFPPGHPYHWPIIGYMADLEAASLDDVREFFKTYYLPNNAVLSIVGDFELNHATDLVHRYFAGVPRGPEVPRVDPRSNPPGRELVLTVEDSVPLTRVFALHTIPPAGHSGHYALDFASDLLSAGKSSRLHRHLVHERELCKDVTAATFNTEDVGVLVVLATLRPGVETAAAEAAIDHEIERLRDQPVGAPEMERTLNRIETAFVTRLESAERRADLLSMFTTYFDEPERIASEIERYRSLTPEAIHQAARLHLAPDHRVKLRYVPKVEPAVATERKAIDRTVVPGHGVERPYHFPKPSRTVLGNGLKVVASRIRKVPAVGVTALVDAGSARDPIGREGLAALTASLLDEGTTRHGSIELAEALDALGSGLSSAADLDSSWLEIVALERNFAPTFSLLAEVLTEASFPAREFERLRQEQLAQVIEDRAHPDAVADDVIEKLLYGSHPYAHPLNGREESLAAISRDDVAGFAAAQLRPATTTLIVVGDVDPDRALGEIEQRIGSWQAPRETPPPVPAPGRPSAPGGRRIYLVDRKGSTQSELRLGNLSLPRKSADWIAAEVMNVIFGGKFTSRINLNLRERHGYTYGARSGFAGRRAAGPFEIATAVDNDATAPALAELYGEIDRIRQEPVSPAELDETKSYLKGLFPLTVETSSELLDRLAEIELYALDDDTFDTYRERLSAVSAADVLRVARAEVRPEDMIVVIVGEAAAVRASLEAMGQVTLLDERGEIV
jgi:zinc protease